MGIANELLKAATTPVVEFVTGVEGFTPRYATMDPDAITEELKVHVHDAGSPSRLTPHRFPSYTTHRTHASMSETFFTANPTISNPRTTKIATFAHVGKPESLELGTYPTIQTIHVTMCIFIRDENHRQLSALGLLRLLKRRQTRALLGSLNQKTEILRHDQR